MESGKAVSSSQVLKFSKLDVFKTLGAHSTSIPFDPHVFIRLIEQWHCKYNSALNEKKE